MSQKFLSCNEEETLELKKDKKKNNKYKMNIIYLKSVNFV